ncbi:MAG: hypothetical protein DRI61_04375 [Chloroflexi bacterium]|nr:MAG: hypothetical protein DRI61_04375 [Chloroflexota bacterium]
MYDELARIAQSEFGDIIIGYRILRRRTAAPLKLRLLVKDGTFIDIWLSPDRKRYSYHWEQRAVRGLVYRHDNAPDHPEIPTFPKHFHDGSEENVLPSYLPDEPSAALREFLNFVRFQLRRC